MRRYITLLLLAATYMATAQTYEFQNAYWWTGKGFTKRTIYTHSGRFTFTRPATVDSVIDLQNKYCLPPFADAHTHNLDGSYRLNEMVSEYLKDGVLYVQVLGNRGANAMTTRPALAKANKLDVTYANGLLTATYGHGFYPYEPLALGIYAPFDQIRLADSIKKSRREENNSYYFFDNIQDVDTKWPLIMKYRPDNIKICLLDAADYAAKRKLEQPGSYGLSPEVAAHVVKKAHAEGLRVFAHVETADDARLCATIGVDVLAHMPGYSWDGKDETRDKYCAIAADIKLFKKAGLAIIPTMNIDHTAEFGPNGNMIPHPDAARNMMQYKIDWLQKLYKAGVPMGLGGDYFGKTAIPEIDSLIKKQVFTNAQLLDLYCSQTAKLIFPKRKLGVIADNYEASFIVLDENPVKNIMAIKKVRHLIKQGQFVRW